MTTAVFSTVAVLALGFVLIRWAVAVVDVRSCVLFEPPSKGKPFSELIAPALALFGTSPATLVMGAMALPIFLAIALSRHALLQLAACSLLLVPVATALSEEMLNCDWGGPCEGCLAIVLWMMAIQLPLGVVLCLIAGGDRLYRAFARGNKQANVK